MQAIGLHADDGRMVTSIARAFRVATEATLSTLAALTVPPAAGVGGGAAQVNAGGGGSVNASANRAR